MAKGLPVGSARCECPTCKECFNSVYAFDRHRVPIVDKHGHVKSKHNRRCLTPKEMHGYGMIENNKGYWVSVENTYWKP